MKKELLHIELWSDIVCPFCYVGKKNLEKALEELHITESTKIIPRSFQLEPQFPAHGSQASIEHLSANKGYPVELVKQMCDDLTVQGHSLGINFNFDAARIFNTFDAHRLIHWAYSQGMANELNEALMRAYTCEGIDLSDKKQLLAVVERQGLDTVKATEVLNGNMYATTIAADREAGIALGLRGVPFFRINQQQIISGAQPPAQIKNTLEHLLLDMAHGHSPSVKATSCTVEGVCS